MLKFFILLVGIVVVMLSIWYYTLTKNEKILVQNKLTCIRHKKDPKWYMKCYPYNTNDGRIIRFYDAPYPNL